MDRLFGWAGCHTSELTKEKLNAIIDNATAGAGAALKKWVTTIDTVGLAASSTTLTVLDEPALSVVLMGSVYQSEGTKDITDSEAILHSWVARNRDNFIKGLVELHGSFCLVLLDRTTGECLLATDRMGTKPLAFTISGECLIYGSTCDLVKQHPAVTADISHQGVFDYLFFHMVPSPDTIYQNIKKLEPAQYVRFQRGQITTDYYWQPHFVDAGRESISDLTPQLKQHLEHAVRRCKLDGETGAFLSGGLDSSTVSGIAADVYKNTVNTYSIGFDAQGYDEIEYARIAAKHFGTNSHEYYVTPEDVLDAIPRIASYCDEPFGNSSAIPVYFCARIAREHGTMRLLAGDGGDELFAGNARYAEQLLFERFSYIPAWLRSALIEPMVMSLPEDKGPAVLGKLRRYVQSAQLNLSRRLERYNLMQRIPLENIITSDFHAQINVDSPLRMLEECCKRADTDIALNRMLYLDWKYTLSDNDLRKVSSMCELAGIEVCYPMLDDELVEFSTRIPAKLKIKGQQLRYFYKKALTDYLPDKILTKSKHGFGLPFGVWLKDVPALQELAYDSLSQFRKRGYVKASFLDWLIEQHKSVHPAYYGETIWVIMMLELWLQSHIDSRYTKSMCT